MTGDEVLCSFCGRNVWWGSEDGPCEHLLADWALDPNDNGELAGFLWAELTDQPPREEQLAA